MRHYILFVIILSISIFSCQKEINPIITPIVDSIDINPVAQIWDSTLLIKKITHYKFDDTIFLKSTLDYTEEFNYDTINRIMVVKKVYYNPNPNWNYTSSDTSFYDTKYNLIKRNVGEYKYNYSYNSSGRLTSFQYQDRGSPIITTINNTSLANGIIANYSITPSFDYNNLYKTKFQEAFDNNFNILWRTISEPIRSGTDPLTGFLLSNHSYNHTLIYKYDLNGNLKTVQKTIVDSATTSAIIVTPISTFNCLEVEDRETQINRAYAKNRFFNSSGMRGLDEMILSVDSSYINDPIDIHGGNAYNLNLTRPLYPVKKAKFRYSVWNTPYIPNSNGVTEDHGYFRQVSFTNKLDGTNRYIEIYSYGTYYSTVYSSIVDKVINYYHDSKMVFEYYK